MESLAPHVRCFKVGWNYLRLLEFPKVVGFVHSLDGQVFYDGKFDDIPNTVGGAAKAVAGLNVKMFNVHASAGVVTMQFAEVTPGVRPEWAAVGDQKRIMTPAEVIKVGAIALVIGRPITKPPAEIGTPADAAKKIVEEISAVL